MVDAAEAKMGEGQLTSFQTAAEMLARRNGAASLPDRSFRDVGARRTRGDIAALKCAAENLAANPNNEHVRADLLARVGALRQPAVKAMANAGFLRHAVFDQAPEKIAARAGAALASIEDDDRPPHRGRAQQARQADAIVATLGFWFRQWTGKNVASLTHRDGGRPSGVFFDLVSDVFRILRIDASPEATINRLRVIRRETPKLHSKTPKIARYLLSVSKRMETDSNAGPNRKR
jgi:hypothetical protein